MRTSRVSAAVLVTGLFVLLASGQEPTPKVVFKGHTGAIYATAFNKDGTIAATASFDKSVRLWDAAKGKLIREFSGPAGHQSLVLSVAFHPAGDQVASGGSDNFARVWDVPLTTPVRDLAHAAGVSGVAVSPDGKTIAGATRDGLVKLWAADGKPLATLTGHSGPATGVAFSANGQTIATCGADGTVRAWNVADGKPIGVIGAHGSGVNGLALVNNAAFTVGEDGLLKTWQFPPPAAKPLPPHADAITSLALSADGNLALTGGADKSVKLSNATTGQFARELTGVGGAVTATTIAPNGAIAAAGSADGKVYLWTAADGKPLGALPAHAGGVTGVAVNAAGNGFVTVGADGLLRTWALPLNAGKSFPQPDRVLGARPSPDGKRLVTAGADKLVRTLAFPAGTPERQFAGHTAPVHTAAITPDNTTIVSAGADETIRLWNATNGTQTAAFGGHVGPIHTLAIAPNGQSVATGGEDGTTKIWALPAVPPKAFAHPDAVLLFAPSPDGNRVLTVSADKQARVWNLAAPAPERTYNLGGLGITAVAYAADNATVALATADKAVSIRNGDKEVKKLTLSAEVRAVAFTPNGAAVVAGLADNSIRVVTIADGKETKTIAGHAGPITHLGFAPKGDVLISAGADKTVRFWNAADWAAKGKLDLAGVPTTVAVSKDGTKLAAGGDKAVALFTLADNKAAGTIATPAEVKGVSLSADGKTMAVASADNKVRVYGPDLKPRESFLHDGPAAGVAFHADGKRLLSTSADKMLRLWTPALIAQAVSAGPVRQVFWTAGSERVLAAGDDRKVRVLDGKAATELTSFAAADLITTAAMTSDAARIVTAGPKAAQLWTVGDGKAVGTIPLPGPAQAVAVSPTGARIAVAFTEGAANRVRVYDGLTGRELQSLPDAAGPVRALAVLADNRTVLVAGDDKVVATHDAAVTGVLTVDAGGAVGVALDPPGNQVITTGHDKSVKLWDVINRKELKTVAALPEPITAFGVSRDFAAVAAAAGKVAKAWQIADGKELASIPHPAIVTAVGFNADRTRLITGAADNLARVWDVKTGQLLQTYAHAGPVTGVAIHPSQPLVVTASADKTAAAHAFALTRVAAVSPKPLRAATATANGSHVVTAGDDGTVKAFNAGNGNEERKFEGFTGAVHAVAISKNVQLLAAAGADKVVRLLTFNDGKEVGTLPAPAPVRGLAFTADAKMLVGVADDKSVTAWNVSFQPGQLVPEEFGQVVQRFAHAEAALAVAIAEKGEVFTGSADKTLKQWKVAANVPTRSFQHPNLVDAVAWSPDGKTLATAGHDGVVRLFDVEKNAAGKTINAHTTPQPAPVYSVLWTTDGKQLLSTSFDKSMKLWDAASGNLVREFKPFDEKANPKGHTDQVFCAAVTKDGKFIASGSSDRKIKLWDATTGAVVREFPHPTIKGEPGQSHPGGIYQLRFTAEEKALVGVGPAPRNQGYVSVWNVADGKLVAGKEVSFGHAFGLAVSPDGRDLLVGFGPKDRQVPEAEAVLIAVPAK